MVRHFTRCFPALAPPRHVRTHRIRPRMRCVWTHCGRRGQPAAVGRLERVSHHATSCRLWRRRGVGWVRSALWSPAHVPLSPLFGCVAQNPAEERPAGAANVAAGPLSPSATAVEKHVVPPSPMHAGSRAATSRRRKVAKRPIDVDISDTERRHMVLAMVRGLRRGCCAWPGVQRRRASAGTCLATCGGVSGVAAPVCPCWPYSNLPVPVWGCALRRKTAWWTR